ncbi:MAG: putative FmdB family regulatory protein [Planctomycetota bacterium]|jgi:putative FmdB family regulatory protein
MPTYDYQCGACGHEFEIFHSMKDAPKKKCPECGKLKLVRQIGTGGGVIFKGSGFYETDYRSESYKAGEKAESAKEKAKEPKADSNSADSVASDSKPKKAKKKSEPKSD